MITLTLNGKKNNYTGDPAVSLLSYLRIDHGHTAAKDGCSGEGVCGACTVEINNKPMLACRTKMADLHGAVIVTPEGLPDDFRSAMGIAFASRGAVQCGFCSPGMIMRAKGLYNKGNVPHRDDIARAIKPNICRCTGYVKIIDAIESGLTVLRDGKPSTDSISGLIGSRYPKYQAVETALGDRPFVDDIRVDGMYHGALRFTDHPKAEIIAIDISDALASEGVISILTATDIPGERFQGLIYKDWPLMIGVGETTRCIGDVLAGVVAVTEEKARIAASKIKVKYNILNPVTDMKEASHSGSTSVHPGKSNLLEVCTIKLGNVDQAFERAAFLSEGEFATQRIEHAFLETESAIATVDGNGIKIYSQGQGVYVDQKQIASILGIEEAMVQVIQIQNGGGFGGKEDLSVQGHVALMAWKTGKSVKLHFTREESIRMHPKRHPVIMNIKLACDKQGKLTALKLKAIGDTGAYASVGTKVMERVVGHATGGYEVAAVDIEAKTVYTNNIPSGAMRGFGVPQVVFAIESCIDDICLQGKFDRWQMRYDNALMEGSRTATGQKLFGVGLKKTLEAVKEQFQSARFAGIACGIKNTGVGNGMIDDSEIKISIVSGSKVVLEHGWSEMGQGVHTIAIQTLHQETGIDPSIIEVRVDTSASLPTGMTTSSRASALVGNAIIDASRHLKEDLKNASLKALTGRVYKGKYICDWTCKPGYGDGEPVIHFAYGYATQVVILDESGKIRKVIAAHDAGHILNRMLFEGQIEGAVHMGLGYALTEDLPLINGIPVGYKFGKIWVICVHRST